MRFAPYWGFDLWYRHLEEKGFNNLLLLPALLGLGCAALLPVLIAVGGRLDRDLELQRPAGRSLD